MLNGHTGGNRGLKSLARTPIEHHDMPVIGINMEDELLSAYAHVWNLLVYLAENQHEALTFPTTS